MSGDRADMPATIDLSVLTPRQRLVITLHYFAGWSEREIATALRISHQAVDHLHKRAIERLRVAALHL